MNQMNFPTCVLSLLILSVSYILAENLSTESPKYESYKNPLEEDEYRTSPQELGIEPYGEEAVARIWSPTRLIPAEEWTGFYSGPVSDDWPTDFGGSSNEQLVASESKSNSTISTEGEAKPQNFSLVYQDTPQRESSYTDPPTSTAYPFYNPSPQKVRNESSLGSESVLQKEYKAPNLRQESKQETYSYGRRVDKNEEEDDSYNDEDEVKSELTKILENPTTASSKLYEYQAVPYTTEPSLVNIDHMKSESKGYEYETRDYEHETRKLESESRSIISALSRIETDSLKHEAVHFNQTNPVVYDPVAKAQSESNYLRHSPLAKHDPFDKKIHAYQYIFGQGPAHNDGKLHSFEETHEYHFPTQYLKRSDRHEQRSSSAPLRVNFKHNLGAASQKSEDAGHHGWKYRNDRAGGERPRKASMETYFYEGDRGRKNVIHEPGSDLADSKTVEMEMGNWDGNKGHVDACFGTGCKYRPKSSTSYSRDSTPDLSPVRPFSSFFAPSPQREAPRFHSVYDESPVPHYSSRHDVGSNKRSSSYNDHRRRNHHTYKESRIPLPHPPSRGTQRKPLYKPSPAASFLTKPRYDYRESRISNRRQKATADVYNYRGHPRDQSYDGAGSDRESKFYRPKSNYRDPVRNKYDDIYRDKDDSRYGLSSVISNPSPYYGPYERHFPDLIAEPSYSVDENDFHPSMIDGPVFNDAIPVSNYNYHQFN